MPPAAQADPQTSLYETTIENPDLEALLDRRESLKAKKNAAAKDFNSANEAVKVELEKLDLGVGAPVRVGGFVVAVREVAGRAVAFDVEPTTRLSIKPLIED